MSRAGRACIAIVVAACAASARSQPPAPAETGDAQIEAYLQRLELKPLLAEQWGNRIKSAVGEEKALLADRLGKLYIELISSATTTADRELWEDRARALVRLMPEAQTAELRLEFARQSYLRAEESAEKYRLRLADDSARADAEKSLRALKVVFEQIGGETNRREESLERSENRVEGWEEQIAEARRLRAIAFYYAGWTSYYLALLTNQETAAQDALRSFGWILGRGGGTPPALDKVVKGFFRYDHVARAAIGTALSLSLRGQDVEAMRWLSLVADDAETSPAVRAQLLPRRILVLGAARRWSDIARELRSTTVQRPLPPQAARLLAVIAFEADESTGGQTLRDLRALAMGDLVEAGEVGQLLDLAQRYGTAPLGERGFIVHYVRGVQAFEKTSRAHKDSGAPAEEPVSAAPLVNAYREASRLLLAAVGQDDASRFTKEASRARVLAGRALFFAGDFARAAEEFQQASKDAVGDARQEPLWFAIVALDKLVANASGATAAEERLEELSTLFIRTFPATDRAANLLMRRSFAGKIQDDEAIKVLLTVPRESAVYDAARRQAARLLYRVFRSARGDERPFAAQRFIAVAEETLSADRKAAMDATNADHRAAVERVIVGARQLLDAHLSMPAPDLGRANAVIDALNGVAGYNSIDMGPHAAELAFRRLQIAVAQDRMADASRIADELASLAVKEPDKARFAASAWRILYIRAAQRYRRAQAMAGSDPTALAAAAGEVIRHGAPLIESLGTSARTFADPEVVTLYNTVAQAAADQFRVNGDRAALLLVVRTDGVLVGAVPGHIEALTRLAVHAESAGDRELALQNWRTLSAGLNPGTDEWFRARYETIRLLAVADASAARDALKQHGLLYPSFGPAPWADKFKALEASLPPEPPPAPAGEGQGTAP